MAGYILLVPVKEFFYYFTGIKLRLFSKKSEEKNQNAETPTRDQPHFSTRQPLTLPPKPQIITRLLTFSTFQYLYTALELKPSLTLTLTLWPVWL